MKINRLLIAFVLIGVLLLSGCGSQARVGELRTESQLVELGGAQSVRVKIKLGAGNLNLSGGTEKLLESDFTYNVAKLKPKVEYTDGTLVVMQPDSRGLPALAGMTGYRNEWSLRLSDKVPMDLSVDVGAGTSNLQLAGLSLTRLDIKLGAGIYRVDLSGNWARNVDVTVDAGAADLSVRLPRDVGTRVQVDAGPTIIEAPGLEQDGNVYTNAAYGVSGVTMQIDMKAGIGKMSLEVGE